MQNKEDTIASSSSYNLLDVIDLTQDSPTVKNAQSLRRNTRNASYDRPQNSMLYSPCIRHILQNTQTQDSSTSMSNEVENNDVFCTDEIITVDDTSCRGEDIHYATELDNGKAIPLTCIICFELLCSKLKPITTRCGHIFCTQCLKTMLDNSKKCPVCKSNVTLKSCTRLFF